MQMLRLGPSFIPFSNADCHLRPPPAISIPFLFYDSHTYHMYHQVVKRTLVLMWTPTQTRTRKLTNLNRCEGLMFSLMVFTFCKLLYSICDFMKPPFFISASKGIVFKSDAGCFRKYPQICRLMVSFSYSFNVNFSNLLQQVVLTTKRPRLLHQTHPFKHHHQRYAQDPLQSMFKSIFMLSSSLTYV